MITISSMFPYVTGILLVIMIRVGGLRFWRGRRLGPPLLKASRRSRWLVVVWVFLGLEKVLNAMQGDPIWSVCLQGAVVGLGGVLWWTSRGFSVHAEGIVCGMVVVFWEELEDWSWSAERWTLVLWSRCAMVRTMAVRPENGLETGRRKSVALEGLLERFAGWSGQGHDGDGRVEAPAGGGDGDVSVHLQVRGEGGRGHVLAGGEGDLEGYLLAGSGSHSRDELEARVGVGKADGTRDLQYNVAFESGVRAGVAGVRAGDGVETDGGLRRDGDVNI